MEKCFRCGIVAVGNSPCGSWCNACGDQDPCPCWNNQYCASHDPNHIHNWDTEGMCTQCPAKRKNYL